MSGGPDEQLAVPRVFPFSALVGQDDLRLALVLCAIDPSIGGALLTGEKGSGKTTAARGLAELLPGAAPFVELPLGAVEERVVGSIDLRAALEQGEHKLQPGLLHTANGGVLYVDEVNLLADHLVDVLLDVAVSGVNRVERDGISHRHLSRFVLVGSMNPEEGQLRPQLLDRFGLSVTVRAPGDPRLRAEAVRRRLAFDADPERFRLQWGEIQRDLRRRLATAQPRPLEPGLDEKVSAICAAAGAEGLRADLVICRAAAALAGWRRSPTTGDDEVRTVAGLALGHRRRAPMERNAPRTELDEVLDGVLGPRPGPRPPTGGSGGPAPTGPDPVSEGPADGHPDRSPPGAASPPPPPPPPPAVVDRPASVPPGLTLGGGAPQGHVDAAPGRHAEGSGHGRRGRAVGARVPESPGGGPLAATATIAAAATRRATEGGRAGRPLSVGGQDIRQSVLEHRVANLVILAVDASGSMGVERRLAASRAAVHALLLDAYQRRDRVAVVTFSGEDARVVLSPTGSTEVAAARLGTLGTGGRTPLAAGIRAALDLAGASRRERYRPLLVLVSDGRATWADGGADPVAASLLAADEVRQAGLAAVVIDCEEGGTRLGLARPLADALGGTYVAAADLTADALTETVRAMTGRPGAPPPGP